MEARPGLSETWLNCGRVVWTSIDLRIGGSDGGGGGSRRRGGDVFLGATSKVSWRAGKEGRSSGMSNDCRPEGGRLRFDNFTDSVQSIVPVLEAEPPGSLLFANFILSIQLRSELADECSAGESLLFCLDAAK
jgi:hypothetical protein